MPITARRLAPRALTVLAGAALALVAACGGSSLPAGPSGITTATPPAAPAGAPATPAVDAVHVTWARQVCAATAAFDNTVHAVQDSVDPATLSVPARVARATARYRAYVAGLQRIEPGLAQMLAPADVQPYQQALSAQVTELQRLFTEELQLLPTARAATDIDAMTADLQRSVDNLQQAVRRSAAALPAAAREALASITPCGQLLG